MKVKNFALVLALELAALLFIVWLLPFLPQAARGQIFALPFLGLGFVAKEMSQHGSFGQGAALAFISLVSLTPFITKFKGKGIMYFLSHLELSFALFFGLYVIAWPESRAVDSSFIEQIRLNAAGTVWAFLLCVFTARMLSVMLNTKADKVLYFGKRLLELLSLLFVARFALESVPELIDNFSAGTVKRNYAVLAFISGGVAKITAVCLLLFALYTLENKGKGLNMLIKLCFNLNLLILLLFALSKITELGLNIENAKMLSGLDVFALATGLFIMLFAFVWKKNTELEEENKLFV